MTVLEPIEDAGIVLQSPRVRLRPWRAPDALSLLALERELGSDPLRLDDRVATLEETLALIAWYSEIAVARRGLGAWRVSGVADELSIGSVSLVPVDGEIEFGGRFFRRAWGRWLGVHVGRLVLRHAFTTVGLARVATHHHPDNLAATAVVRRLGFEDLGFGQHFGRVARRFVLSRRGWEARWASVAAEA